jgi:hypothetical protein
MCACIHAGIHPFIPPSMNIKIKKETHPPTQPSNQLVHIVECPDWRGYKKEAHIWPIWANLNLTRQKHARTVPAQPSLSQGDGAPSRNLQVCRCTRNRQPGALGSGPGRPALQQ